jgi:uncharacterized membrane protein (DUF485 family)
MRHAPPPRTSVEDVAQADRARAVSVRARAHWRVALAILGINCGLYAVLILLIAYNKPLLGRLMAAGLSLAIVFGAVVTVAAWLLTLVYVRWANRSDHAPGRS